jgi:hypothetical protein
MDLDRAFDQLDEAVTDRSHDVVVSSMGIHYLQHNRYGIMIPKTTYPAKIPVYSKGLSCF